MFQNKSLRIFPFVFVCFILVEMATQFYLTLPSNSSKEYSPNNMVANFKVKLAETIELTGDWEIALSVFHYPYSWCTLQEGFRQTYNIGIPYDETAIIPNAHSDNISDLVRDMNGCMKKEVQEEI